MRRLLNFKFTETKFKLLFLVSLAVSLWLYSQYFTNINFGDEYDNFTYSWLLKNGLVPYRDFFTHHFPALIFIGYPIELIGHSKVVYRLFVLLITFGFFSFFAFYLKGIYRYSILVFMIFSAWAISFYSGYQYADGSFWAIFLMAAFFMIISKEGETFKLWESILISILILLTVLSSPMHIAPFSGLFALHIYLQFKVKGRINLMENMRNMKQITVTIIFGLSTLLLFLVLTSSVDDFYLATIQFNDKYFYFRDNVQIIHPKIADFYLHSTLNFANHISSLAKTEGQALLTFIKSLKFIAFPWAIDNYTHYLKIIFTDFYNNFLSFEVFIVLFYIFGLIAMLFNKFRTLAFFTMFLSVAARLRVPERIHEAPYYLLSYWMLSFAIVVTLKNIYIGHKRPVYFINLVLLFLVICLFVNKNIYDFKQIAYNSFSYDSADTVEFIKTNTDAKETLIVIAPESARTYWESNRLPAGYFVNYFPWYGWSERLRERWASDISSYDSMYLVVNGDYYKSALKGEGEDWVIESVGQTDKNYVPGDFKKHDYILLKRN